MTAQTAQSFPVYKKVGNSEYLFVSPGGSWRVGPDPSTWSGTGLKCPGRSPTPPEPPADGWQFYDDGWHDDDTIQVQPAGEIIFSFDKTQYALIKLRQFYNLQLLNISSSMQLDQQTQSNGN